MKTEIFRGIATALATPMDKSGNIDYAAYGRLIDWQIDSGVAGLVACGTTGEAATMTTEEHSPPGAGDCRYRQQFHRQGGGHDQVCLRRRRGRLPGGNAVLQQGYPGGIDCPLHRHCRRFG